MDREAAGTAAQVPRPSFSPGMILLLVGLAWSTFAEIPSLTQEIILGPLLITGIPAIAYKLALAGASLAGFVGILARKQWARSLVITLVLVEAAVSLLALALFLIQPQKSAALAAQAANAVIQGQFKRWAHSPVFVEGARAWSTPSALLTGYIWGLILSGAAALIVITYLHRQRQFFSR